MQKMTLEQAFAILSDATEPMNAGRINRAGYVQITAALQAVQEAAQELAELRGGTPKREPDKEPA
jgi:hypothetical protein